MYIHIDISTNITTNTHAEKTYKNSYHPLLDKMVPITFDLFKMDDALLHIMGELFE